MDIYITEADGSPAFGAWSTFDLAVKQLVKRFGIDPADIKKSDREPDVWSAPSDMDMGCCYINKVTLDVYKPIPYID